MSVLDSEQRSHLLIHGAVACALFGATALADAQPAPPGVPPVAALASAPASSAAPRQAGKPVTAARLGPALPSSGSTAAVAAEIQKINEQMALLQAQLNQLELKAKIASKQKEMQKDLRGDAAEQPQRAQSSFDSKAGNPSVLSVAGIKGKLEAVLVFPGGVSQRVKAGDVIDDRKVATVELNEVVLTDLTGGNAQRLAFGTAPVLREKTPPASPTPGPGGQFPNLPLPPMPPAR